MTSNSQAMANRGNINQKNLTNNNGNNISSNNNGQQPYFNSPMGPFGYPPMMVMPYPQSQSSDSMRLLEKMMELKSEENKQLMEILLQ